MRAECVHIACASLNCNPVVCGKSVNGVAFGRHSVNCNYLSVHTSVHNPCLLMAAFN